MSNASSVAPSSARKSAFALPPPLALVADEVASSVMSTLVDDRAASHPPTPRARNALDAKTPRAPRVRTRRERDRCSAFVDVSHLDNFSDYEDDSADMPISMHPPFNASKSFSRFRDRDVIDRSASVGLPPMLAHRSASPTGGLRASTSPFAFGFPASASASSRSAFEPPRAARSRHTMPRSHGSSSFAGSLAPLGNRSYRDVVTGSREAAHEHQRSASSATAPFGNKNTVRSGTYTPYRCTCVKPCHGAEVVGVRTTRQSASGKLCIDPEGTLYLLQDEDQVMEVHEVGEEPREVPLVGGLGTSRGIVWHDGDVFVTDWMCVNVSVFGVVLCYVHMYWMFSTVRCAVTRFLVVFCKRGGDLSRFFLFIICFRRTTKACS